MVTYCSLVALVSTVLKSAQYTGQCEYNMNFLNTMKTAFSRLLIQMNMSLLLWTSRKELDIAFVIDDVSAYYSADVS